MKSFISLIVTILIQETFNFAFFNSEAATKISGLCDFDSFELAFFKTCLQNDNWIRLRTFWWQRVISE
jgi:hypothetical protein